MAEKLKGKKLNFGDSNNKKGSTLTNKEVVHDEIENVFSSENTFKVKTRKIKKPRRKGISFTQAINVSEIKKASEKAVEKEKIRGKKIKEKVIGEEEKVADNALETEETMSIAVILLILLLCFIVGVVLGYLLYHIAINSSNALLIVQSFLK